MQRRSLHSVSLLSALGCAMLLGGAFSASAQNIDDATDDFRAERYEDAASAFYAITRFSDDPADLVDAQYGLAKSFQKLGLTIAALKQFEDIVAEGEDHAYFDKAVEALIDIGEELGDDLKIPPVIDAMYDRNQRAIKMMQSKDPDLLQRIHYVIGKRSFERGQIQDARSFLKTVKEGNPAYARAQYLLGLIRLGIGRSDDPLPAYDKALKHFDNVIATIDALAKPTDQERQLRDRTTLAIGRTLYERAYQLDDGDPKRTADLKLAKIGYKQIPRFSEAWGDALFERAWAHTVANEYGKALGALHSLQSPYFKEYFYPEAQVLKAIIYYYNCHWDRVNATLEETKAMYQPMVDRLEQLLEKDLDFEEWYTLLNDSLDAPMDNEDPDLVPWLVARDITRDAKFKKMEAFLRELEREANFFDQSGVFGKSEMGREMAEFATDTRDAFLRILGKYVKARLNDARTELNDITTRASIVSLETKTAEADWLDQGRDISNKIRKRQPRPAVPDETFQYWVFRGEYWIDELGYYRSVIKTECYE